MKLVIAGEKGRMGQEIKNLAALDPNHFFSSVVGFDKGGDASLIQQGDVIIDFTQPSATLTHVQLATQFGKPIVIGTTGIQSEQQRLIDESAKSIAIVQSPNMSMGVNVLFKLIEIATKSFQPLNIEVSETHHADKKDAPSGTALGLGHYVIQGDPKWKERIPYHSLRLGKVVGDHTVHMAGWFERLELTHRADSRAPFAAGALRAAQWVIGKASGKYSMQDVLGLNG
jgi:4-hydroxy-tetrahydrodipicolinate reductase